MLINGSPGDAIAAIDRGLQYGDGLFETISCVAGRPRWLALHFDRLKRGIERLGLPFGDFALLEREVSALANGQERCFIKLTLTRGPATRRGYAPTGDEVPTRIVSRHEWVHSVEPASGFRLGLSDIALGSNPALAGLKHLNRLEQVMAQRHLVAGDFDEVLMKAATGEPISGSMSNVFIVDPPFLVTPALHACGVDGVMRRLVLEHAGSCDLSVQVRPVTGLEVAAARELFVTNVRLGVQPVTWYQGRKFATFERAGRLQSAIDATWR